MALTNIRNCPVYVINLDRRPDRWETFSKQPALNQFKKVQRFSAVDGKTLNVLDDTRISQHTRQNIARTFRRSHYEICTPGAIGASFSHIAIWKKLAESNDDYCVVFEDDTIVDQKALNYIDALIEQLPPKWDMWLLGCHRWAFKGLPANLKETKGWWNVQEFTGAHAYVISKHGAKMLLQECFPIETHIEYYISGCSALKGLRIVKHWSLRMGYEAERTEELDSDTFDSRKSCPTCYVPDNMDDVGFYMTYYKLNRMAVGLAALAVVGLGGWLAAKR